MKDVKEKAKVFLDKAKERLKKVSKKIWLVIAAVLVALIVVIAIMLTLNKRDYAVLVTQVSNTEASTILNFLSNQGVTDYRVEDGNTILVPTSQESSLKARILMENLNQTGNYYMENLSSFSTNEERTTAKLMDLQTNMAATIRNIPNVIDAMVNIAPGENRAYILDSNNVVKATAAVFLTMADGTMLTDEQATAIQQFISNSVQGLEFESVSISDATGNVYLTGDALNGDASALMLQLRQAFENRINTNVKKVLDPIFGEDNVKVAVTCDVEVSRVTEQRHETILPDYAADGSTNGEGIIGSQREEGYIARPGDNTIGGVVGTESNSDLLENVETGLNVQDDDTGIYGSRQTDYDNSHSEIQIDNNNVARMTDCSVAVSINSRTAGDFNVDAVRQHVARAANIKGELDPVTGEEILDGRIHVLAMEFYDPNAGVGPFGPGGEGGETVPLWVLIAAGVGLLLFIILLTVILLLRRKKRKKQEAEEERQRAEAEALLAVAGLGRSGEEPETGANVMDLEMERSMELRKDIRQFAQDNPEIAAQMIKSWLRGGDDNG